MLNNKNVLNEFELYQPMQKWLYSYLRDKYKGYEILAIDTTKDWTKHWNIWELLMNLQLELIYK